MGKILRYLSSMLPMPLTFRARIWALSGVHVGKGTAIDRGVHVTSASDLTIGERVTVSTGVSLLCEVTAVNSRLEKDYAVRKRRPIVIENDAYLGVKATVLPGITIGRMATVAANSLIMQDVPRLGVAVGVPARVVLIREERTSDELDERAGRVVSE